MPQAGFHALIGLGLKRFMPSKKWLLPSIVFGAILPDIDSIAVAVAKFFLPIENPVSTYHRTFSHSIFTIIFVYLCFYLISRYKRSDVIKTIGKGIAIGMFSHVIADIFLWFHSLSLLWPLSVPPFDLWKNFNIPQWVNDTMLSLEFLFFSLYAYVLIRFTIKHIGQQNRLLTMLRIWMNVELFLFIFFAVLVIINIPGFFTIFGSAYIPSLLIALFFTVKTRQYF